MKLRWTYAASDDNVPTIAVHFYESVSDYKLQQWWEDDARNGEWRDVPKEL